MRYFNKGSCSNGITCKQSHDTQWLLNKQAKNGLCYKVAKGLKCKYSYACFHIHDLEAYRKKQIQKLQANKKRLVKVQSQG